MSSSSGSPTTTTKPSFSNPTSTILGDLHVVTENGDQCFMWHSNELTYIAQDRHELPLVLATRFGQLATKLDLSYNALTSYRHINLFTKLSELILDNNELEDDQLEFRQNLRLKTLSLNKNKLTDLAKLVVSIKISFPNLEYLSLLGNPLCPVPILAPPVDRRINGRQQSSSSLGGHALELCDNQHNSNSQGLVVATEGDREHAYQKYRHFIIYHLPNLRFLDSRPISWRERDDALNRCAWLEDHSRRPQVASPPGTSQQLLINHDNSNGNGNGNSNNNNNGFQLTIMSDYDHTYSQAVEDKTETHLELQVMSTPNGMLHPRGVFTRLSYKYTGKNSEGNRFLKNNDL